MGESNKVCKREFQSTQYNNNIIVELKDVIEFEVKGREISILRQEGKYAQYFPLTRLAHPQTGEGDAELGVGEVCSEVYEFLCSTTRPKIEVDKRCLHRARQSQLIKTVSLPHN